jgi:hypothetical protein
VKRGNTYPTGRGHNRQRPPGSAIGTAQCAAIDTARHTAQPCDVIARAEEHVSQFTYTFQKPGEYLGAPRARNRNTNIASHPSAKNAPRTAAIASVPRGCDSSIGNVPKYVTPDAPGLDEAHMARREPRMQREIELTQAPRLAPRSQKQSDGAGRPSIASRRLCRHAVMLRQSGSALRYLSGNCRAYWPPRILGLEPDCEGAHLMAPRRNCRMERAPHGWLCARHIGDARDPLHALWIRITLPA